VECGGGYGVAMADGEWRISVDTGGTFTDCYGISPGGEVRVVKLLSSGRLRLRGDSVGGSGGGRWRVEVPAGWSVPDGFFVGFRAALAGCEGEVMGWSGGELELAWEGGREWAGPGEIGCGAAGSLELWTGEEAPVVGARLLTGAGAGVDLPPMELRLGTTRGTNALLEREVAKVVLFVSEGFGDLLQVGDQRRPELFALEHVVEEPLARWSVEVEGRMAADGSEVRGLGCGWEEGARRALGEGAEVAVVALLHSYRAPGHEEEVGRKLREMGYGEVVLSHEVAPFLGLLQRGQTAVVEGSLRPVVRGFLEGVGGCLGAGSRLLVMGSGGGLEPAARYRAKDSLLSGPAGGVVGAVAVARRHGRDKILTFDMGGTSTDVARYSGAMPYRFTHRVGAARLVATAVAIETVAAGGGSICHWTGAELRVGPGSAGAWPGPACYGRGGPLTLTDVNLLLGRIDPDNFGIPLGEAEIEAARDALARLVGEVGEGWAGRGAGEAEGHEEWGGVAGLDGAELALLRGLVEIACEQMADAIRTISVREGVDPAGHALVAFGGAGPLHACEVADKLGVSEILVPWEAGLLSAYGLSTARVERMAERQVLESFGALGEGGWRRLVGEVGEAAEGALAGDLGLLGGGSGGLGLRILAELRVVGQDAALAVEAGMDGDGEVVGLGEMRSRFAARYEQIYGHEVPEGRELEVVSVRAVAGNAERRGEGQRAPIGRSGRVGAGWFRDRSGLVAGQRLSGPTVVQDPFSTLYVKAGWELQVGEDGTLLLGRGDGEGRPGKVRHRGPEVVEKELFRHRFTQVVEEMGAVLGRAAISTNIKERLDYSCALLDGGGGLVANAPHIPVHLGAMGLCVREVVRALGVLGPGDVAVSNHPGFGGSHLPDVTLISPFYASGGMAGESPMAYVANRAHHAEIGGSAPGSMPAGASCLEEEGVVIAPRLLVAGGEWRGQEIEPLLLGARYPTRRIADNLADLRAQAAANRRGLALLAELVDRHGAGELERQLAELARQSRRSVAAQVEATGFIGGEARDWMDDGAAICCRVDVAAGGRMRIDFGGTALEHGGNLNATPAIVRSAVLYALRLWTQADLPLNEGLLGDVDIILPECFLNPRFPRDAAACPAVVGGNVETSQRIVDVLLRIFGLQAASQGTMNNLVFGDEGFGYYETVGGGAGAGPGYAGASGIHSHMTNTAITDAEVLEHRYPVRLWRFGLRRGSGGVGRWGGGDGLVREIEFLRPLRMSLLAGRRVQGPPGMAGGGDGMAGRQVLVRACGEERELPAQCAVEVRAGERLRVETPGGGAWGAGEGDGAAD